jgi:hypothetical protein
MWIVYGWCT